MKGAPAAAQAQPLVILGAGLAGLSAAYHAKKLGLPHALFERAARVGGLVRSERVNGFCFDYTGHLLHMKQPRTRDLVLRQLGLKEAFVEVQRRSFVYMNGRYTRAPFQANLYGQPASVVNDCLEGVLKARAAGNKGKAKKSQGPESFESWNLRTFGEGIYRHFMEPYNSKLWGVHPSKMTTEFMGRFIPQPSLAQIFEGALQDQGEPMGYNANFIYPKRIGIEVLSQGFGRKVAAHLNHVAVQIDPRAKEVTFANGRRQRYSRLISTMPLTRLIAILSSAPAAVLEAASRLKASSVLNVNFGISNRNVTQMQWVYVPEKKLPFYRVGFYHNFSKNLAPKGGSSVYAEISYSRERPLDKAKAPERVRQGLMQMGLLKKSDTIAASFVADIPSAYVVYDAQRTPSVEKIQAWLRSQGIVSTGRWGRWEYAAMEDAIWQGAEAVGWKA
jgi:protoporphyrinogen oxidase